MKRKIISIVKAGAIDSIQFTCPECGEVQTHYFFLNMCVTKGIEYVYCNRLSCRTRLEVVVADE